MATLVRTETLDLAARFPGSVTADARPGYCGLDGRQGQTGRSGNRLRDEFGFDLLSSVTGVDYYPEQNGSGLPRLQDHRRPGMVFKVQVPRVDPIEVPSVTPVWPGAEFQEREIWDLYRHQVHRPSRPAPHPDVGRLRRPPLRKDWQEPFYEEDNKPSRAAGRKAST